MPPSDEPPVLFEKRGHVAHVVLNRPHVLNAMNGRMHEALAGIWDTIEADEDIWVAVLSGAGPRAFCVGQDLKELAARVESQTDTLSTFGSRGKPGWPRLTERFSFSKPIVCRAHGFVLGGGFELALACDIIVASEDAVFGLPEAKLGLIPGAGGVFRLVKQLPMKTALGYLLTGRRLPATRAFELGLVNEVVPPQALDAAVDAWVADLCASAPLSLRAIKQAASESQSLSLEQSFSARYSWEEQRMRSSDAKEGPVAFAQKRPPRWTGH